MGVFFSFSGRIGRMTYWMSTLGLIVAAVALMFFLLPKGAIDAESPPPGLGMSAGMMLVINLAMIWCMLAISVKRWHDRDKSGWWVLITLIPVIGALWALVENGFLKGTDGPNSYGPDPLT